MPAVDVGDGPREPVGFAVEQAIAGGIGEPAPPALDRGREPAAKEVAVDRLVGAGEEAERNRRLGGVEGEAEESAALVVHAHDRAVIRGTGTVGDLIPEDPQMSGGQPLGARRCDLDPGRVGLHRRMAFRAPGRVPAPGREGGGRDRRR